MAESTKQTFIHIAETASCWTLKKYLRDHGITVDEIELMNGMIGIWLTGSRKPVMVPQDAHWGDVVGKLVNKVVIGEL